MADISKLQKLIDIMETLRGENGCPWDKEQDHESLKRYLLEESYEVLDAIDAKDDKALCDELGDVLLQVVFHAQIAAEEGRFTIDDVADAVNNKMIRRHPHIFGEAKADNAEEVLTMWEQIKAKEKESDGGGKRGLMKINDNLPALLMAQKIQDKASRVGFDWSDIEGPRAKLAEELEELSAAKTKEEYLDELGDVLFAAVNVARFLGVDAEDALRHTNHKFIHRFEYIEEAAAEQGKDVSQLDLETMDALWDKAKAKGL